MPPDLTPSNPPQPQAPRWRALRERWRTFHRRPRRVRWTVKIGVMLLTIAAVLYPKPWLLPTYIARLRDLNSVVDRMMPMLRPLLGVRALPT